MSTFRLRVHSMLNILKLNNTLRSSAIHECIYYFTLPLNVFLKLVNQKRNFVLIVSITLFLFSMQPFIFTVFTTRDLRLDLIIISAFILMLSTKRFSQWQLILLSVVSIWALIFSLSLEDSIFDAEEKKHEILTLSSIYVWGILLYRSVEFNLSIKMLLIKCYMIITGLLALFSILSIIYYYSFGSYFFSLSLNANYNYLTTPFGVLLTKRFFGIEIIRAFNYFSEPVFASIIFAGNFHVIKKTDNKLNFFRIINLIAGLLLFSYAYYIFYLYFYFSLKVKKTNIIYLILLIIAIVAVAQSIDLMESSSLDDRVMRSQLFFTEVSTWGGAEWFFGGSNYFIEAKELDVAFNMGLMQLVWDYGILGLIIYFFIVYVICSKNTMLVGAITISCMIVNTSIYPIYYLMAVVFGEMLSPRNSTSNT